MIATIGLLSTLDFIGEDTDNLVSIDKNTVRIRYNKTVQRIYIPIQISACHDSPKYLVNAVIDTGAIMSCVSQELARKMKLTPIDTTVLVTANSQSEAPSYMVDVFFDTMCIKNVKVCSAEFKGRENTFLIGMDILNKGKLVIDNINGATTIEFTLKD